MLSEKGLANAYGGQTGYRGHQVKSEKFFENAKHRNSLAWKACFRLISDVQEISKEMDEVVYNSFNGVKGDSSGSESESEERKDRDRTSPRKKRRSVKNKTLKNRLLDILKKMDGVSKCSLSDRNLELGENFVWVGQECGHLCHVQAGEDYDQASNCNKCGAAFRAPPKRVSSRYKIQR